MIKKLFRFLYKETSALHQAAYLLGLFAILSQVLAFVRDRLLAHVFGASSALDSYYAAFRIPDFLFVTVASIVSLSVLVPFIVEREKAGKEEVRKFVDDLFSFFSYVIIGVSVLAFILMPVLAPLLFKGLSIDSLARVVLLSRVFLLSPIFLGFSNLLGSLTQAYNRFIVYAAAPLLYNLGIILGTVFLAPHFGVLGVALGVVAGSFMHMGIQLPFVAKLGLMPRPKLFFRWPSIRKVAVLSAPRTLSLSVNHIAQLFLISLASLMAAGSISIYSFALNIQSVPLSIIGVSYSLAAFPTLTRHFADQNFDKFVGHLADTARHIIFWSLPATALFIVLRTDIIRVLLGSGRFDLTDTRLTAAALALFSLSALAQSLLLLFTRAFYAAGHTKKPFLINVISAAVTVAMAYAATKLFMTSAAFRLFIGSALGVRDIKDYAVLMLPLGYSIGTNLNALIHWYHFEKDFGPKAGGFTGKVWRSLLEVFFASLVMAGATAVAMSFAGRYLNDRTLLGALGEGLIAGFFGIIIGLLVLAALNNREARENWTGLKRRLYGAPVAADPETEII